MKKMLPAYAPLPETDLTRIWKNGLIVLDANVLLNVYCYSPATRDDLLDGLATVLDRLWLPHQAATEFYLGRPRVIEQQRTQCKEALEAFEKALKAPYSDTSHPFVSRDLRTRLEQTQVALQKEIKSAQLALETLLTKDDPIRARLETLFDGRVGAAPTKEEREAFYAEATTRYKYRIPPGFADDSKPDERKYGDFVLWKQMIQQADTRKMPILFVTDDTKNDWWWKAPDRRPLPALRVEMERESGQLFQMYETTVFIREARTRLKWKVKDNTLKEVADSAEAFRRAYSVLAATGALGPPLVGSTNFPSYVLGSTNLLSTIHGHSPTGTTLLTGAPLALALGFHRSNPGPASSPYPAPAQPAPPGTDGAEEG